LELEFRRIRDDGNAYGKMMNLELRFMDKKSNSTGLQLADLIAHPIGRQSCCPSSRIVRSRRRPNGFRRNFGSITAPICTGGTTPIEHSRSISTTIGSGHILSGV
jgi:hypothetical protein